MNRHFRALCLALGALTTGGLGEEERARRPIPDKLVVLTFDDGNVSDLTTVAPILQKHGFGATFFLTSGWLGGEKRLGWPEVARLQAAGFEIGSHTTSHPNLLRLSPEELENQIAGFERECAAHGIRKPTSFSYPGGHFDRRILALLKKHGYLTARRGRDPELPLDDNGGNGRAYVPGDDHPFLIPSTMTRGIGAMTDEYLTKALAQATAGRIAVLTYHGVPDVNRHCSTPVERFRKDMNILKDSGATVVALRDLARYVDLSKRPADAFAPIVRRLGLATEGLRCDTSVTPPRLSWKLVPNRWTQKQVAYRVLVASSRAHLDREVGDLWDSGKVTSPQSANVPYGGRKLESGKDYWWKVQVWNRRDLAEIARMTPYQSEEMITELHKSRPGPFSEPSPFRAISPVQESPPPDD